MTGLDTVAPRLHTLAEAADLAGVPVDVLEDLTATAPPSHVLYVGPVRYPLLTLEDIEAATGARRALRLATRAS